MLTDFIVLERQLFIKCLSEIFTKNNQRMNLSSLFPTQAITGPMKNAATMVTGPTSPPRTAPMAMTQMSQIILTIRKDSLCTWSAMMKGTPS